jgi:broad specificity phosphatase PhoE
VRRFPHHILPEDIDEVGWARHWSHETREELYRRVDPVAAEIRKLASVHSDKAIVIVIHGGSGDMLLHHLLHVPLVASVRFHHDNCAVTLLRFKPDGQIKLVFLNDRQHLAVLSVS